MCDGFLCEHGHNHERKPFKVGEELRVMIFEKRNEIVYDLCAECVVFYEQDFKMLFNVTGRQVDVFRVTGPQVNAIRL